MLANLDLTHGLIMAEAVSMTLAKTLGKAQAHRLVEAASRKAATSKTHLKDILLNDKAVRTVISAKEIERLFEPASYHGVARLLTERLLASARDGK